ncbi:MAG TPA: hypothetical protein VH325_11590 [Bryobacteraceae bacterium]|nr:hypothetical protein [Bryobacteraceae bacterium]
MIWKNVVSKGACYLALGLALQSTLTAGPQAPERNGGTSQATTASTVVNFPHQPIVISRFGPYPASITRPKGPFMLLIENHSGFTNDTFYVESTTLLGILSSVFATLTSTATQRLDYAVLDLVPGSYQLVFPNHPKWKVAITITGQ